jgi:hypothetical protein
LVKVEEDAPLHRSGHFARQWRLANVRQLKFTSQAILVKVHGFAAVSIES